MIHSFSLLHTPILKKKKNKTNDWLQGSPPARQFPDATDRHVCLAMAWQCTRLQKLVFRGYWLVPRVRNRGVTHPAVVIICTCQSAGRVWRLSFVRYKCDRWVTELECGLHVCPCAVVSEPNHWPQPSEELNPNARLLNFSTPFRWFILSGLSMFLQGLLLTVDVLRLWVSGWLRLFIFFEVFLS